MGLIREPLNVDFYVIDRPISAAESKEFSEFIKRDKKRQAAKRSRARKNKKAKETA